MEPYYHDEAAGITIFNGDCRDVLPTLAAGSIDLVLTDPPYGETSLSWDERIAGWPGMIAPLLSGAASLWCFGSVRFFMESIGQFADYQLAQDVVWEKHNGSGLHADRFRRVHELILQFYPRSSLWRDIYKIPQFTNDATARKRLRRGSGPTHQGARDSSVYVTEIGGPRLMRSVIYARSCHRAAEHPTQKPLEIVTPLLSYSCVPGGLVVDPFMGSGTTLAAAKCLGLSAIGIEISEAYCEVAVRRLQQSVLDLGVA